MRVLKVSAGIFGRTRYIDLNTDGIVILTPYRITNYASSSSTSTTTCLVLALFVILAPNL